MHSHLKLCAETATTGDEIPLACIAYMFVLQTLESGTNRHAARGPIAYYCDLVCMNHVRNIVLFLELDSIDGIWADSPVWFHGPVCFEPS